MDFDILIEKNIRECNIEYGVIKGNEKIVFIKSGNGGSYRGYNDKYLLFAEYLHSLNGCSVICASNPIESRSSYDEDLSVICEYILKEGFTEAELYLFGNSDGCFRVLELAEHLRVCKTVIVNMPLMINFYRTKEKLKRMEDAGIVFVYGEHDPSYEYLGYIKTLDFCKFVTLENTSHRITITDELKKLFAELIFE